MTEEHSEPIATYRLQLNQDFRFTDAQKLVNYFSRLGITHVYASPIMRARASSTHGYDVVDPGTINPNLGDKTDLVNLVTDLRRLRLGLIVDIVPNHMAASIENPYWRDVLTYGPSSPFACWFDIDWRMPDPAMWGRVLVPVLGESRRSALEQDHLRLTWSDGRFLVHYFDHLFPVDPATIPAIVRFSWNNLEAMLEPGHPALQQIRTVLENLERLPKLTTRLRRRVTIQRDDTEQWLADFARQVMQSPAIQQWVEDAARDFGQEEAGRIRLRKLLDMQPYRLVYWRDAARTINYRRFFDINELVSIRQEDPHVFQETHASILRWLHDGLIDGLRIDHIDGLRDPLNYLQRLAESLTAQDRSQRHILIFVEKILAEHERLPCGWPVAGTTGYEFLNQVEALLVHPSGRLEIEDAYRRMLRRPVHFEEIATWGKRRVLQNDLSPQVGRLADRLLHIEAGRVRAAAGSEPQHGSTHTKSDRWNEPSAEGAATGPPRLDPNSASFERAANASSSLESPQFSGPLQQPLTKAELVDAIVEVIVALPVYRTYIDSQQCVISDADRHYLEAALAQAIQSGRAVPEAVRLLGEVLLLENRPQLSDHELNQRVSFIHRFQQLTGPAAAKGIEDTALYAYVPLVSLNEVGGEPGALQEGHCPVEQFHQANMERATAWPQTMLSVTTHDTKRTADVRARLDVLSEVPKLWTGMVRRWQQMHQTLMTPLRGKRVPDANTEYLMYQTIVGIWPAPDPAQADQLPPEAELAELRERVAEYMLKAVREAKTQTSWTRPRTDYEEGVQAFARRLLSLEEQPRIHFLVELQQFVGKIARAGYWNSLTRTLLQYTSPGSPDLYQGDELWNFALVDPDNRRPVDFELRCRLLDEVIVGTEQPEEARDAFLRELVERPEDGRIKLHLIHCALAARRDYPGLFAGARYEPLEVTGKGARHVVAFARVPPLAPANSDQMPHRPAAAVVVAPRWTLGLGPSPTGAPIGLEVWGDTELRLPEEWLGHEWSCLLTRRRHPTATSTPLRVADLLEKFPAALLISKDPPPPTS
jgi:(1->4)-alpha-D-glucan 1-alpha-D-glucosylmutase